MSIVTKWIIAIVVLAAIAWGLWWSGWLTSIPQPAAQQNNTATTTASTQQPSVAEQNGMSSASDTSDAALTQDAAAVDAQMQGLNSDSASTDSSFSDQPVSQAY